MKTTAMGNAGAERPITVIGGGLAGCEIALQLAEAQVPVRLVEMKPAVRTPAQVSDGLAELVCSNSFRSDSVHNAIGLLKWEMRQAGSAIMRAADASAVPAGDALAVDREIFSALITERVAASPYIEQVNQVVDHVPGPEEGLCVIATGPLTHPSLAQSVAQLAGKESLFFYDAIAPIIDADSIDWSVVWRQSRYDKGEGSDYANVPLSEEEYHAFVAAILEAEKLNPRPFEESKFFEGCLPIEVMAQRGPMTLAFGPMRPVGLVDPRTGETPFAVVQLRMENLEATAWNFVGFQTRLKYPEQRRILRSLPGLSEAVFLRYGSIHRNTYLHAPSLLSDALHWHDRDHLYFAGQITGVEGYVESAACGQMIAWHLLARLRGEAPPAPPPSTAFGALRRHLRADGILSAYAPSNLNWSLFAPMERQRKERKQEKKQRMAARAQADFSAWWRSQAQSLGLPSVVS